jgi:tRNA-specific 2-thiouridylase
MHSQPQNDVENKRVVLGLSGGVDSAVAAILLQQRGAEVHALHMTNWEDDDGYCTAADDLQDARNVCEQLGIPLHHVNFSKQYRDQVFEYFLAEYKAGRTPNPDVLCNREIKFGVFRDYAKRLGGELLATGHYARSGIVDGHGALFKGADPGKDQSYFLHAVSADAFSETVFPLGEIQKADVRKIARDAGLDIHDKKDSTGICFIGERPFREFLATFLPANPGRMQTPDREGIGEDIGEHQGLMYYTLGQRQGLRIGGRNDRSEEPWYVVGKDLEKNVLLVAQGEHEMLFSDSLIGTDCHWIGVAPAEMGDGLRCRAKVRYRQNDQDCVIKTLPDDRIEVRFDERQKAVAPGQFVVFYDDDRCLGGAVIDQIG